ncbi:hypothetical protein [Paenibacillus sp. 7523-1]|uniref:hypothetical protein n=1 Tax=Paenibacillus sp. 7523-1 TaxID=2022550 RepID=UPI000BA632EC|nr:hypothetical protein [Paenibacillus sp. 7523-1]PAD28697.1 hypothetical protein CHH60_23645 [Paenibacillus sp. 7523-1]
MQKPLVGSIVRYHSYSSWDAEGNRQTFAAIIMEVIDRETVHLCVLEPTGQAFYLNVMNGDAGGQWNWPISSPE